MQDLMLERIVDNTGQAVVAVEYRLAPEHPYPAGPDDCEAAAVWLVQNGKTRLGQPDRFSPWGMAKMLRVDKIGRFDSA